MDIKRDLEVLKKYFTDHQKSVGIDEIYKILSWLPMDIIISYSLHPVNPCRKTGVLFLPANQHAPPFALRVVSSSARGSVTEGHCGGSRHRKAVTFPPRGCARGVPLHTLVLTFLV